MLKSIIIVLFFVSAIYASAGSCQNTYMCTASAAVSTLAAEEVIEAESVSTLEEEEETQVMAEETAVQSSTPLHQYLTRREKIPPLGYKTTKDSAGTVWCITSCEWFADMPTEQVMNQTVPSYNVNNGQICAQCAKPYLWYKLSDLAPKTTCFSIHDIQTGVLSLASVNAYKAQCADLNALCRCAPNPIQGQNNITLLNNNYQETQPKEISVLGSNMNSTVFSALQSALDLFSSQSTIFSSHYAPWYGKFSRSFNEMKQLASKYKGKNKTRKLRTQWRAAYRTVQTESAQYGNIHYPYFYAGNAFSVTLDFLDRQYRDYAFVLNSFIGSNIDSDLAKSTLSLIQRYRNDLASVQKKMKLHYTNSFDKVISKHGTSFAEMIAKIEKLNTKFL